MNFIAILSHKRKNLLFLFCLSLFFLVSPVVTEASPQRKNDTKKQKVSKKNLQSSQSFNALKNHQKKQKVIAQAIKKEDDFFVPIAPLPSTYRDIQIQTSPSNLVIGVWKGKKLLQCSPANKTPCKVRVFGFSTIPLQILVYRGKEVIRYARKLRGRDMKTEHWFLALPPVKSQTRKNSSLFVRTRPVKPRTTAHRQNWFWIAGGILVVGGITTGVILYIKNRDNVGFKCVNCIP